MAANKEYKDVARLSNGRLANASFEEKKQFANYCFHNYKKQNWSGSSLFVFIADNFNDYSVENITILKLDTRRYLQDLLGKRVFYVSKGRNIQISASLYQVIQDEMLWPEDDPEKSEKRFFFFPGESKEERVITRHMTEKQLK